MREIVRENFLRPLTLLPGVVWLITWLAAIAVGRLGLWLELAGLWWTVPLGRVMVFLWLWLSLFLVMWQVVLGYLYIRFKLIQK